jgi:hypothetical protein
VSLYWRIFVINAALLVAAAVTLAISPATVSSQLLVREVLVLGLGLAAAACASLRFAAAGAAAVAGSIVGAVAFVALVGVPMVAPEAAVWPQVLARYPALVAMPLGWLATRAAQLRA